MKTRAAIYARLSLDPNGTQVKVDRQLADCRELARRKGWTVAPDAEHRDDSKSAWRRNRKRPGWDALLAGIKAGDYDAVVTWHGDRLVRQPYDLEELIRLVEDTGLLVASPGGTRDLGSADDRFIVRIETAAACRESDSTARRVRKVRDVEAQAGKRHGFTPYGWRTKAEAKVVRQIVRDLLKGESLRSVTARLNDGKVPAPRGGAWSGTQVRQTALRWSNAGVREHRGKIVADGKWRALVGREDQERVIRLLTDPARRTNTGHTRRHLLSGIVRCGVCGGPLRRAQVKNGRAIYRCGDRLCVNAPAEPMEDRVMAELVGRLSRDDAAKLLNGRNDAKLTQARKDLRDALSDRKQAGEDYADHKLNGDQIEIVNARIDQREAEANATIRAHDRDDMVDDIPTGPGAEEALEAMSLDRLREVIRLLMTITLERAAKRGGRFNPERVRIGWRRRI